MKNDFVSSKDSDKKTQENSTREKIKIMNGNNTNEIINGISYSLLQKY